MEESAIASESKTDGDEAGFRIVNGIKLPPKKTISVRAKDLKAIESNAAESKKLLVEEKTSANASNKVFEWEWFFMVLGMVCFALISPRIAIVPVCALGFLVASIATARYMREGRSLVGFVSAMGMVFFLAFAVYVQSDTEKSLNISSRQFEEVEKEVQAAVTNAGCPRTNDEWSMKWIS